MKITFAPNDAESIPLLVLRKSEFADWQAGLPAVEAQWVKTMGFSAGVAETLVLPASDGTISSVVFGLGNETALKRNRFILASARRKLPKGVYELRGNLDPDALEEASLGWLLAGYRFGAYSKTSSVAAELKAPEGVSGARLETIAAGEALTRDLINTPTSDMGPQELENAAVQLAERFGAKYRDVDISDRPCATRTVLLFCAAAVHL